MTLSDTIRRHGRLLWWLHSLYALAAGIVVMWVGARHFAFLRFVFIQIAFIWTTSLLLPWLDGRPWLSPRVRWWIRAAINYLNKDFYQQLLFFVLPVYYASATPGSWNMVFIVMVGASAVLSTFDVVYNDHLVVRPTLLAVFFAFNLFVCLNVALPVIWSLRNGTAMWASALLAVVGFATLRFRPAEWRRPRVLAIVGAGAVMIGVMVAWGRPLVPPAPLRLVGATFGRAIQEHPLAVTDTLDTLPVGWAGRLYTMMGISAPRGLRERVHQRWFRNGSLVYQSPDYEIVGGREDGYRLWTSASLAPGEDGPLRVDVETEGGQLIGRATLQAGPASQTRAREGVASSTFHRP